MAITVFQPSVQIRLLKMVGRKDGVAQRYAGAQRDIDLTPYLGDGGAVRTVKGMYEPAGGFSLSFPDQVHPAVKDSVYALVEPMDMVEIRMAREPHKYAGGKLPLVMRGWVSSVRRSEAIGSDGEPERSVIVQGQDAGKLWLIHRVIFQLAYLQENPYLNTFQMQAATGMQPGVRRIGDFFQELTEKVMNDKVAKMAAFSQRQIAPFRFESTVDQGCIIPQQIGPMEGTIWSYVESFIDRPWNEAWIEDEEQGPILRFRPVPFKDQAGKVIMPRGDAMKLPGPNPIEVDIEAVVSLDVARSDARLANFFCVPPGGSTMNSVQQASVSALRSGWPTDFQYGNNTPDLYGVRMMNSPTVLLPTDLGQPVEHMPPADQAGAAGRFVEWHQLRSAQLKALNRDNGVLEDGSAVLRGDETLKPGRTLRLTRGDLTAEFYLTRVVHSFEPCGSWTTTVALERGTGFLERLKGNSSPYHREGRQGPYR